MNTRTLSLAIIALLLGSPICRAQTSGWPAAGHAIGLAATPASRGGDAGEPHASQARPSPAATAAGLPEPAPLPPLPAPKPDDRILDPGDAGMLLIGPFAGLDYNMHTGQFTISDGNFSCCTADGGSGLGLVFGGKAFIPLSETFSLSPRILYEGRGGTFTGTPDSMLIFGQNQQLETAQIDKEFKASIGTLGVDLLATLTVTDFGLYLAAGPSASYVIAKDFSQTATITRPSGVTFLDGSTSQEMFHGDLDIINRFQMALRGGVGANIPIAQNLYLNPEALYGFPLTKFSKQDNWKGSTLQGTIGLMFAF
ncbi:MAG: PorT family protein [Bacteroidetes bacterium]|nr:PorT family protein [Bacteroidota bacterium]